MPVMEDLVIADRFQTDLRRKIFAYNDHERIVVPDDESVRFF